MALQRVDDIKRGDGLALGVLSVCDGVTNDRLEEGLEDTACLFVDHCRTVSVCFVGNREVRESHTSRDTLDTATTSETTDSWFCDTLDVVSQDLSVTLSTALAETFAAFATCTELLVDCSDDESIM